MTDTDTLQDRLASWLQAMGTEANQEIVQPLIDRLQEALAEESHDTDPFQRDPEFIASMWPILKAIELYFGTELRGWENVPKGEPVLIVGNHSGGMLTFDPAPLMLRWFEARGTEAPIYGLTYDLLFAAPGAGAALRKLGCLPASHENARLALDKGASVIVFPGGDYEVFRPWSERNQIQFGERMGFIELAIRAGVRVVPMTIHGAHESAVVLTRGREIAQQVGLDKLRIKVFPLIWNLPFGPTPAFVPSMPLPSKITVELGQPLDWSHRPAESAEDPAVLHACYQEVTGIMQETLDRLAEERPFPLLSRLNDLNPSRAVSRLLDWMLD